MKNISTIIIISILGLIGLFIVGSALQEDEPAIMDSLSIADNKQDKQINSFYNVSSNESDNDTITDSESDESIYSLNDENSNTNELITKITTERINLMAEADEKSPILSVIPKGTPVQLYEDCDCEWICIAYNNHYGYVNSKFLYSKDKSVEDLESKNLEDEPIADRNSISQKGSSSASRKSIPEGATAICNDGTFSFSAHRQGTCSWHGGVYKWLE